MTPSSCGLGSGCDKTYLLDVTGVVSDARLASLSEPLDDVTKHTREKVRTAPARVKVVSRAMKERALKSSFPRAATTRCGAWPRAPG